MKQNFVLLALVILLSVFAVAQPNPRVYPQSTNNSFSEPCVLSFFSENNDFFYVILNGIKQNINAQSVIRIEGINQPVNDVQIIFADNVTREIQKRITLSNPIDNRPVNLTLKIVKERDGDAKLRFYMSVPKEINYQPAQGEYVMFYGQDVDRTKRYDNDRDRDHDRDRNHDGDRNRGQYQDRDVVVINTPPPPPPAPIAPPAPTAMDMQTFANVKQTISNNSFDDTKLSTAKMIISTNLFTTDQVIELCGLFSFEQNKLEIAKFAYKKTIDNNNYFRVNDVFTFDASKEALNNYISKNH